MVIKTISPQLEHCKQGSYVIDCKNKECTLKSERLFNSYIPPNGGIDLKKTILENDEHERKTYEKKGNPFKRGKTWTYICYPIDPITEKKTSKWCGGFNSEKEAKEALKQAEAEIQMGIYVPSSKVTVEKCINHWFERVKLDLQPNTINGYLCNINNHILPAIGCLELGKISKNHIANLIETLKAKDLSPRSIKYIRDVLKMALDDAVNDGVLKRNPCIGVSLPKQKKYKATVLDLEEAKLLISSAIGSNVELEVFIGLSMGLRRGEILGLKYSDFNFTDKVLHIVRQVTYVRSNDKPKEEMNYYGLKELKTESSDRTIYVPQSILDAVEKRNQINKSSKSKLGKEYHDQGLLCCQENGDCLSPQTMYHRFKKLISGIKLPDIRFHDLRHSCASLLLDMDIPLKVISQMLGHSTIGITADIYCEVLSKKKQTADAIEANIFAI